MLDGKFVWAAGITGQVVAVADGLVLIQFDALDPRPRWMELVPIDELTAADDNDARDWCLFSSRQELDAFVAWTASAADDDDDDDHPDGPSVTSMLKKKRRMQ